MRDVCIMEDLDNLSSDNRGCTVMTNPSEEGMDFTHVYTN